MAITITVSVNMFALAQVVAFLSCLATIVIGAPSN